jgi:ElaB/YqjD/DUF883 family membrane-anchored ribosome-binding protein
MAKTHDEARIRDALDILNQVAEEEKERLQAMLSERYDALKEFLADAQEGAARRLSRAYKDGKEKVTEMAGDVDKSVHSNPWAYIGGAAALGLLVGIALGRNNRR